jgi:hypothetical protein
MRYRSEDSQVPVSMTWKRWNASCVQDLNSTASSTTKVGAFRSILDVVTPRFKERMAAGEVIVNPLTIVRRECGAAYNDASRHWAALPCNREQMTGGYDIWAPAGVNGRIPAQSHLVVPLEYGDLHKLAGTSALANVKDPDVQGLIFIGELKETLRFLRRPLATLGKNFKRYQRRARHSKRKGATKARTLFEFLSENWLAYRYGIMPLVLTAEDAVVACRRLGEKPHRYTARGYAQDDADLTEMSSGATSLYNWNLTHYTSRAYSVRAGVIYEMNMRDSFGVEYDQIPAALWEIIPFSFVVDWFANVGEFITAITPKVRVTQLGSWTTSREISTSVRTATSSSTNPGWVDESAPGGVDTFTTTVINRDPGLSLGLVSTTKAYPKGSLGTKRILDSLALINGVLFSKL